MSNIINAKWLINNLDNDNLVIVDCRYSLIDKEYPKKSYEKAHIKGAVNINIEEELYIPTQKYNKRYLFPNLQSLKNIFENKGISNDSVVVVYDDGDLIASSKLLWVLKYLGHEKVYILNGGIEAFRKAGGEIDSNIPVIKRAVFNIDLKEYMKADMEYIRERLYRNNVILVDCRDEAVYNGKFNPINTKIGHIPGAENYCWKNLLKELDSLIFMKTYKELKFYFNKLRNYEEVIVYCDTNMAASLVSLALNEIGINHKLYMGGFMDWISYTENEVC